MSEEQPESLDSQLINNNLNQTLNATAQTNLTRIRHEPDEEEMRHAVLIFYLVMFVMIFAQTGLVTWRRRHRKSYELVTLIGLWLIPPMTSLQLGFWRFLFIWFVYSCITGFFLYSCSASKLDKHLPKRIYRWFFVSFKTSVVIGVLGYSLLLIQIFGAGMVDKVVDPSYAIIALWYGLYFGILSRDCAEVASDRIAAAMGTARRMAVSVRDCAICGCELQDAHVLNSVSGAGSDVEPSVQLSCKHLFHPDCIRGWLIVGKKDSCPTCQEKVDLRSLYANKPWETRNLSWIQMLDMVRYMVVWQPTILIALHFIFSVTGLDDEPHHHDAAYNSTLAVNGTTAGMNSTGLFNQTA